MKKAYIAPTVASYNTTVGIIPLAVVGGAAAALSGAAAALGGAASAVAATIGPAGLAVGSGLAAGTAYGLMKGNDYLSVKPISLKKVSI